MLRNVAGVYIEHENQLLLLYGIGSRVVESSWCNIGGHMEQEELNDPKACMLRELFEETGIKEENLLNIRLKYITLRNKNNEIPQNYHFFAEAKERIPLKECSEGILEWVGMSALYEREMPFTARKCLLHYYGTGKYDHTVYGGIAAKDGIFFSKLEEF